MLLMANSASAFTVSYRTSNNTTFTFRAGCDKYEIIDEFRSQGRAIRGS